MRLQFVLGLFLALFSAGSYAKVYVPKDAKVCRMDIVRQFPEVFCDGKKVRVIHMSQDAMTDTLNDLLSQGFSIIKCDENPSRMQKYSCLLIRK